MRSSLTGIRSRIERLARVVNKCRDVIAPSRAGGAAVDRGPLLAIDISGVAKGNRRQRHASLIDARPLQRIAVVDDVGDARASRLGVIGAIGA